LGLEEASNFIIPH